MLFHVGTKFHMQLRALTSVLLAVLALFGSLAQGQESEQGVNLNIEASIVIDSDQANSTTFNETVSNSTTASPLPETTNHCL